MFKAMNNRTVSAMVRHAVAHGRVETLILKDEDLLHREVFGLFKRVPRGVQGVVRSFANGCSRCATNVAVEESRNAVRFVCPYLGGAFGKGLVNIDAFLFGFYEFLLIFGFKNRNVFNSRKHDGHNWKFVYDGYFDYFRLTLLHQNMLAASMKVGNRSLYYHFARPTRLIAPYRIANKTAGLDGGEWRDYIVMKGGLGPLVRSLGRELRGRWPGFDNLALAARRQRWNLDHVADIPDGDVANRRRCSPRSKAVRPPPDGLAGRRRCHGFRQQKALALLAPEHVMLGRHEGGAQAF